MPPPSRCCANAARPMPEPVPVPCLQGTLHVAWNESTVLIVAAFKEWGTRVRAPPWLAAQWPVVVYQRLQPLEPCYVRNHGSEAGIYLHFIVQNYHRLPRVMVFMQADFATSKPQDFWQPRCAEDPRWEHWMPLSSRLDKWPPRQLERSPSFWECANARRKPHERLCWMLTTRARCCAARSVALGARASRCASSKS